MSDFSYFSKKRIAPEIEFILSIKQQKMAKEYANMRNVKFLLNEVHKVKEVLEYPMFSAYDEEAVDMMIDAAKQIGDTHMFPYLEEMDRFGVKYEKGSVKVHPNVKTLLNALAEGGWISAKAPEEWGGMDLPFIVDAAAQFIFAAANNGAMTFAGLTFGAANLILSFGTDELKEAYLPQMFGGKWQGTMCLTEPQAGSSLADASTFATPQGDGTYKIKGQKIFISGGDGDGYDNVVHMVLARVAGAPAGTKGISLFLVPKLRKNDNGEFEHNDVTTAGVYQKLGQKSNPACHLMFGEKDDCIGYLIGQENRGLIQMFQMMNEARLAVGLSGAGTASAAYHMALEYAMERPQGRRLNQKDMTQEQVNIIQHPDVRRMLLLQKSVVEGSLSLLLECAKFADLEKVTEGDEKEKYALLLDILTPIANTYPTEMGIRSVSESMQCLGGYGYCKDFPAEIFYRDVRIMTIYEGTTGIQSQDLLGRKVTMHSGKALMLLAQEIMATIAEAQTFDDLKGYAKQLSDELMSMQRVTTHLLDFAKSGDVERFLADANFYMEMASTVVVAWQWLKQATFAKQKLVAGSPSTDDVRFYESKIHTFKYYFTYELPKTMGLAHILMGDKNLTISESEKELIM